MSADMTLVEVARYAVEGECRTAISHDYRRVTRSYHTCEAWSPLPLLKAHGARHSRTPGPSAAMEGMLAATPPARRPSGTSAAPMPPMPAVTAPPAPTAQATLVQATPVQEAAPTQAGPTIQPGQPSVPPPSVLPAPVVQTPVVQTPVVQTSVLQPPPPLADGCTSTPLDVDKASPTAVVLYNYWQRLRGKRAMPAAPELNIGALRDTVGRLCLFALAPDGQEFVYRACGRAVQRRLSKRVAGLTLADAHEPKVADRLRQDLRACLDEGQARALLVRGDPVLAGQTIVEVMLPLTDALGRPALVLAYRNVPGG